MCVSHAWCMYVPITHQYTSLHRLPSLSCPPCFLYHPYITHPTIRRMFSFTSTCRTTVDTLKSGQTVCPLPTTVCRRRDNLQLMDKTLVPIVRRFHCMCKRFFGGQTIFFKSKCPSCEIKPYHPHIHCLLYYYSS